MKSYSDKILYETRQHKILLVMKVIGRALVILPIMFVVVYLSFSSVIIAVVVSIILFFTIFYYHYFFWSRSYFIITNERLSMKVRNGLFSMFHMNVYYENIKDVAYSKNNLFHYAFNYGNFFARSSAGADGDFLAPNLPDIETVYNYVNFLYKLSKHERANISQINLGIVDGNSTGAKVGKDEIIAKEKQNLLSIQGIKEVYLLTDEDRKFIFSKEEERNHGVYESIKRNVVFCATHDSSFRDPDNAIVLKIGNKAIFPAVSFSEVRQKNTVSSSPGLEVHNYLIKKLNNYNDKEDATLLIGFDI